MEHRDTRVNNMVAMITSKENTSGTVVFPRTGWTNNFNVTANSVTIINLPTNAETIGSETVSNNGIKITTDAPSSVYIHQYFGFRSEATIVLPVESLGDEYFVMSYRGIVNNNIDYPSEFLLIGKEDSTVFNIQLSSPSVRRGVSSQGFEVILNEGQTYQVQASSANGDLTGSFVSANKDFAMMAGNAWTQVPTNCTARDNLLEQMYPVSTWGKSFLMVPFQHNPYDIFRVLASEDGTIIKIGSENESTEFALDRGGFYENFVRSGTYITSNKPVMVAQYVIGTNCSAYPIGDPSMVLINSIEQTRDKLSFYSSPFEAIEENYISITTRTEDSSFVLLDGTAVNSLGARFTPFVANPEYSYTTLQVNAGSHTLESSRCGLSVIVYGYGNVESYAYNGGASFNKLNAELSPVELCLGDPLQIDPGLNANRFSFEWDFGDGESSTEAKANHTYENAGVYPVSLLVVDECLGTSNTLDGLVTVYPKISLQVNPDQELCEGGDIDLDVEEIAGATYSWVGPDNFSAIAADISIPNASPEMSGTYSVIAQIGNCPSIPAQTNVNVIANPRPTLGQDTFFCPVIGETLSISPGDFASYTWEDQSVLSNKEIVTGGKYYVEVANLFGCRGSDTLIVDERCPAQLTMPNVFSPNGDQINDVFAIDGIFVLELELKVFDRWGKMMYESSDPNGSWDGRTPNGTDASPGVYYWQLQWEGFNDMGEREIEQLAGSVLLVR